MPSSPYFSAFPTERVIKPHASVTLAQKKNQRKMEETRSMFSCGYGLYTQCQPVRQTASPPYRRFLSSISSVSHILKKGGGRRWMPDVSRFIDSQPFFFQAATIVQSPAFPRFTLHIRVVIRVYECGVWLGQGP